LLNLLKNINKSSELISPPASIITTQQLNSCVAVGDGEDEPAAEAQEPTGGRGLALALVFVQDMTDADELEHGAGSRSDAEEGPEVAD